MPGMSGDQAWNRFNRNGYMDMFALGNMAGILNPNGDTNAIRYYFMQRDTNHDGQWNRDEFDGRPMLPGTAPGLANPDPSLFPANPQASGQPPIPGLPNQQAPANNNFGLPPGQGNTPSLPNPGTTPQPPANSPQPANNGGNQPPTTDTPAQPQSSPAPAGQDTAAPEQESKKQADAKKPDLTPDQRFQIADIADNKEHKPDLSIDLAGLIKAVDTDQNGTDEKEYQFLAVLLGLKTPFSAIEKDKATGRASEAAALKAAKEGDENNDDKLSREEFDKMNLPAPAKDGQPEPDSQDGNDSPQKAALSQDGKDAAAQEVAPPVVKPNYFKVNKNGIHGIEQEELLEFLSRFADSEKRDAISAKGLQAMIVTLGWDKSQKAQLFLNKLLAAKDGMSVADIVKLMFDRLDINKGRNDNFGLVRHEVGDLFEGGGWLRGTGPNSGRKHRRRRR